MPLDLKSCRMGEFYEASSDKDHAAKGFIPTSARRHH